MSEVKNVEPQVLLALGRTPNKINFEDSFSTIFKKEKWKSFRLIATPLELALLDLCQHDK